MSITVKSTLSIVMRNGYLREWISKKLEAAQMR